jgi:hypothetical protein
MRTLMYAAAAAAAAAADDDDDCNACRYKATATRQIILEVQPPAVIFTRR